MASRLASRLKPSGKKSPGTSRSNTPTHSQSNIAVKQEEIPSIDDVLTGPEIQSLKVSEDELRKLHESVIDTAGTDTAPQNVRQVVVIKDNVPVRQEKKKKSVAVLYPLPSGVKPKQTKLLGSTEAGPRCDEDAVFISHSILGTVEEYVEADRTSTKPFNVTQVPSTILPVSPYSGCKKTQKRKPQSQRESHALQNWEKRMEERKILQDNIRKRLQSSRQLVMNRGNGYRAIQEQRSVIDRAIPSLNKGKGHYVGSEFWTPQPRIGDEFTGITLTLTKTERGFPPDIERVKVPSSVRRTQGLRSAGDINEEPSCHSWKSSNYLKNRKSELKTIISNITFSPSVEGSLVEVTGHSPGPAHSQSANRPHTASTFLNSRSLDSLGDEKEDEENSLLQSTSILDLHPNVITRPLTGPALKLNDRLLQWTPPSGSGTERGEGEDVRVTFETLVQQPVESAVQFHNAGTTSIYYNWKKVTKPNPLGTVLPGKTQRFYFDTKAGVLPPGGSFPLSFTFKSSSPGTYRETWCLETRPQLCGGGRITVTLRGVAFQPDINKRKREEIEEMLTKRVIEVTSERLVNRIVDSIQTPHRIPSPLPLKITEEEEFLNKNSELHVRYHYDAVVMLKRLYIEVKCPSLLIKPPSQEGGNKPGGGTKKGDDKGKKGGKEKKEGGGKGGGKGGAPPAPSHEDVSKDAQGDQNLATPDIPPWNLSIASLQEMILSIEEDDRREELFVKLNSAMASLSAPPPVVKGPNTYTTMYSLLCESIDDMSSSAIRLRSVMGLPPKDLGLKNDEESGESELAPAHSDSPVQGGKKDQGKKGKAKDSSKDRPSSKQKGKLPRKGSFKGAAKTVISMSSKSSSNDLDQAKAVDPILEAKFKQNFYSLAYYILKTSIQQADELLEAERRNETD